MDDKISLPDPLIPLETSDVSIDKVGGKGVNLAKLSLAGYPVPSGFIISTSCYRDYVNHNELAPKITAELRNLDFYSPEALEAASSMIRTDFEDGHLPKGLNSTLEAGCHWLGDSPVAVRSSATAEDLSELSFAGQQDTFLNIIGSKNILDAVIRCWSSLWTARAIGYRARNQIAHDEVALAVIVQKMVPSDASGVLFTTNPLTGKRTELVIDATLGLGEALVAGQVEPDHYVINSRTLDIISERIGTKATVTYGNVDGGVETHVLDPVQEQAVPDEILIDLAKIGIEIEALFGCPQDIEWAYMKPTPESGKVKGNLYILQSRAITSLFPLPDGMTSEPQKFLVGFHVVQGIIEPLTPLGQDVMKYVITSGGRVFGLKTTVKDQSAIYSAADRLWINFTPILQSSVGYKVFPRVIGAIDPGVAGIAKRLLSDSTLVSTKNRPAFSTVRRAVRFLLPFLLKVLATLRRPNQHRKLVLDAFDAKIREYQEPFTPTGDMWHDFSQAIALLHEAECIFPEFVVPKGIPPIVAGMAPFFGILERFSKEVAEETGRSEFDSLYMEIARGLPHNVTTEMDLFLWDTAQVIRKDPIASDSFLSSSPEDLATAFLAGEMRPTAQAAVKAFLDRYGFRCLGEIDIGKPRWIEGPMHIMSVLQNYLKITDPSRAPDVVFARGADEALKSADKLISAVSKLRFGWIKKRITRFAVNRYRALAGMREAPKFFSIRMMGIIHQALVKSGVSFTDVGLLSDPYDLFFLEIEELERVAEDKAFPSNYIDRIVDRKRRREKEMKRTNLPRVLLSDGATFYEGITAVDEEVGCIIGDPVSPGTVVGVVRVVFDPHKTQIKHGEILVCLGTDPAWTPLFLTAGGLVMEVGGMMTHGSVVAREYGIPAVVGVDRATTRLETGQRVRVDGSSGRIILLT